MAIELALLAGIFAGFSLFLQKIGLQKVKRWQDTLLSFNWLFGTLLAGVSFIFYLMALRVERIAITQPLVNISVIVLVLLEIKFLKEEIKKYEIIAIMLFFLGLTILMVMI